MTGNALLLTQSLITGVMVGSMLGLVAVGLTLIFGVSKVVTFAHGDFLAVGMYITFALFTAFKFDPYLSAVITIPALFLMGVLLFWGFVKPLLGKAEEFTFVLITFGIALLIRNTAQMIFSPDTHIAYGTYTQWHVDIANINLPLSRFAPFIVSIIVIGVLYWLLHKTDVGRTIRATAENREAAESLGINSNKVYTIALGIGCACLGVAAPFLLPIYYVYPAVGMSFTLLSFLIVVMGGMGNIAGAMVGGLIIGVVQAIGAALLTGSETQVLVFAIFVLVLVFRPQGILVAK